MINRMIDNPRFLTNREHMEKDGLTTFLLGGDTLRGVLCNGSLMVNQMKANHQLQIAETLILGRNYIAAALLSANLKEEDLIKIQINCTGPLGGLNVEADYRHRVRGYLLNNPIDTAEPGSLSLPDLFGEGILSFTRMNRLTAKPFTGQIELQHGNTAKDLAYYFTVSEQLPSAFRLDVAFSDDGNVPGAGGLLIQAMPGAEDPVLLEAENAVASLPSLGQWFARGSSSEEFILSHFGTLSPRILTRNSTEFHCSCSRDTIAAHIAALSEEDKADIIRKDEFPVSSLCHNCGTVYHFSREESLGLFKREKGLQ